jgi:tetratricopeptide (TPR) repeat protein
MYCKQCGAQIETQGKFCSSCGHEIQAGDAKAPSTKKKQTGGKWIWALPVATLLLVATGLGVYYAYELKTNRDVEAWREKGETLALAGKFQDAKMYMDSALKRRPNHETVQADNTLIEEGIRIQNELLKAQTLVKEQKYPDALKVVEGTEGSLKDKKGPLYDVLQKQVQGQKTAVTVAQIKQEMNDKKTIEELAPLLTKIGAYDVPEAKDAAKEIRNKIADIAYQKANELLPKKQFNTALALVEQGLSYDASNSKLLSFKETITKQRADFENAEQQRLAQAMASAAKEKEQNQKHSVEVVKIEGHVTEYGDFAVTGEVKNVGTKKIRMVQVFYNVYDEKDQKIDSVDTYVYPNYLEPGQSGKFESTGYGIYKGKRVEVTDTTWYLD